ncbi:phosphotransferase family protein [Actinokineospora iranica]|uniref:Aminoglycoside phosphotransferase domain-containing protein n=1 Tax=Actinokineospora iranica TaxID=1271860 RepID=A0A1G6YBN7_9PSEU|nr:hypothetical protein [Actinokineospora iranica]SDD87015.1 hypothetical protein SAMN05216174_120101 [Actinokineospora iranica]
MRQRTEWFDLPDALRDAITARTGEILDARTVSEGMNSPLAATLRTTDRVVFVKGTPNDHAGVVTQGREAMINPHVRPVAPALLWHIEDTAGWDVLGFEHVEGRHPDYAPGSPDLPAVVAAVDALGALPCPDLPIKDENRWRSYLDGNDPSPFAGSALLHTDYRPSNLLVVDDGTARIVDWAWPTRGAPWIDPACLLVWLIAFGHTPDQAEAHAARTRAWKTATPEGLDLFALANVRLWDDIAGHDPQDWTQRMSSAAQRWAHARGVSTPS